MSDDKNKSPVLVEQQFALHSYLDALLREVPDADAAPASAPDPTPDPRPAPTRPVLRTVPPVPEVPPHPALPEVQPQPEPASAQSEAQSRAEAGPPAWAQEPFQCLLFKVAGLSLAVPLAKMNGVIPWQDVTPMPNRSSRFLGLLRHLDQNVKVVDTARIVLPPDRMAGLAPSEERVGHILLVGDGQWGLACDSIGEVLTLGPDDVRWRSMGGKRPWLAGTVLAHLCALLDVDTFCHLLATGADGAA